MRTTIDPQGKIALGTELLVQLGLKPGEEVVVETRGQECIIRAANSPTGLCYEGNLLVHRGDSGPSVVEALSNLHDERLEQLSSGLPR